MKRIVTLLCMIACVLCLAGCNGEKALTDYEQAKIATSKQTAKDAFLLMVLNSSQDHIDNLSEMTKEEREQTVLKSNFELNVDGGSLPGMLISFQKGMEEIGQIDSEQWEQSLGEPTARIEKHQIIVDYPVISSKGEAIAEFVISNDMFQKVEGAALNPQKTFGQMMQKAGLNTVIGMGTVFSMLLFMSIIISCFGVIPKIMGQGKKEKENQANTGIQNAVTQIEANEAVADEADDCELVAVIAAAIAAFEGSTSTDGFVVRSIRKRNK